MDKRLLFISVLDGGKAAVKTSAAGLAALLGYSLVVRHQVVYLPYAIIALMAASVLVGGFRSGMAAGVAGWLHGVVLGLVYMFIALLAAAFLFPSVSLGIDGILSALLVLLSGAAGGIAGVNTRFLKRRRVKRYMDY